MAKISKLYIDAEVKDSPIAKSIASKLRLVPETVENLSFFYKKASTSQDSIKEAKKNLLLTTNKGAFIKSCPGTREYICCGYKILHIATFCVMDCSYCILQAYFHPPVLQFFVNYDEMLNQLDNLFAEKKITRIGTGEFTDSLIWEDFSDLNPLLIKKFSKQSRAVLELKTKTVNVAKLENLDHNRKTITAWSLNTQAAVKREERGTTAIEARLKAAAKCESWGYPVAFHFDPIFIYPGCEKEYKETIEKIFQYVSAKNIVWISLGTFRFMPGLKQIIEKRFPGSNIVYGEFITGIDGKMRCFKPLRIEIYCKLISYIRSLAKDVLIYFCMEDEEVWEKTMGFKPADRGGLPMMLDKSAAKVCGLS